MTDRTVVYRIRADVGSFAAQMRAAAASTKDAADKMTAATREGERFRAGLDQLGGTAGKVGLVAAAGVAAFVTKTANFEQAMSNVSASTHETTENMQRLRQAALDAGQETAFSATEAAAAIENLAKAGVSTSDILSGALAGSLDLAAAGGLGVAEAAEFTATALTQFKLSGDQATHVADLLAAGAGKAQGEVSDMANALNYVGVPAANLGVTIEETAGSIALLSKNGIIGEQAGTSLRGMLASLTSPSKVASQEMDRLGVSVFDASGKFVGFEGVAGQLESRMGGLTDAERANALGKIFGNEQLQAANVLYREGADGVARMTTEVNDQGFAAETASKRMENLKGDLEQLGGALETALIGTGESSQGALRSSVQGLTDLVNAYNDLPGPVKTGTAALTGTLAVLGGGAWVGSKAVRGAAETREALSQLGLGAGGARRGLGSLVGFLGGPWGLALTAGVTAVGVFASKHLEASQAVNALKETLDEQTGAITENSREWAIKELSELGALGTAKTLGIDLGLVTDAALGNAEAMAKVNEELDYFQYASLPEGMDYDAWNRLGVAAGELESQLGGTNETLDEARAKWELEREAKVGSAMASQGATEALGAQTSAMETATTAAGMSAQEFEAAVKAYDEMSKQALDTAEGFANLGDSLNDSKVSLGGWLAEMENSATALRDFRKNAVEAAKRGLDEGLIASLQKAGPEGALRMKQLADGTEREIDRANRAHRTQQREIEKYIDLVAGIPPTQFTQIKTNVADEQRRVSAFANSLANLRDRNLTITTTYRRVNSATDAFPNRGGVRQEAFGGPIYGPGTATSDSIPAYLSNGEYVIRAAAVQKYGTHMFDRLNAMRFASGGSVSKRPSQLVRDNSENPWNMQAQQREEQRRQREELRERIRETEFDRQQQAQQALLDYQREQEEQRQRQEEARYELQRRALEQQVANLRAEEEMVTAQREAVEEQRRAAQEIQDATAQAMSQIGAAAISAFNSDLFTRPSGNLFAAGTSGGDWFSSLQNDTRGLQERSALISQLSGAGLSQGAFGALLEQADNRQLRNLIESGQLGAFGQAYDLRASLQAAVSGQAGQAVYGADWAAQSAATQALVAQVALLSDRIQNLQGAQIQITESISAEENVRELARLMAMAG